MKNESYKINVKNGNTVIANAWECNYRDALAKLDATLARLFRLGIQFDAWEVEKVANDGNDNIDYTMMTSWNR